MKTLEPIPPEIPPALGRMTRIVGHDVRNKLAVMRNSIYYLNMKLGHGDEKVRKHLRILEREIADANRIILNFMDFALVKEPALQKSNLKTIVAEALAQAPLPEHWKADAHLDDSLPPVMADAGQLQRAFTNIILRIIEGMPEGGRLRIRTRERNGFVEVWFEVSDWVISEEELAAVTSPFVPANSASLGMIVSKKLVEKNRGTMEIKRFPGEGTVFAVRLPLLEGEVRYGRAD